MGWRRGICIEWAWGFRYSDGKVLELYTTWRRHVMLLSCTLKNGQDSGFSVTQCEVFFCLFVCFNHNEIK